MSAANTIDSPRKKLKVDVSPQPVPATIPESPLICQEDVDGSYVKASHGAVNAAQMYSAITRREDKGVHEIKTHAPESLDEDVQVKDVQRTRIELTQSKSKLPARPNAAIRRAGFPSQHTNVQVGHRFVEMPCTRVETHSLPQSSQYMRQYAQQFSSSATTSYTNGSTLSSIENPKPQDVTSPNMQQQRTRYAYPQQSFHPTEAQHQIAYPMPSVTSMANQYSTAVSRPRQRLVQRAQAPIQSSLPHTPDSRFPYYATPASQHLGGHIAEQFAQQSRQIHPYSDSFPESFQPHPSITASQITKLAEVFPHLPDMILRTALIQARGHVDDAQALIADDRVIATHNENPHQRYSPQGQVHGTVPAYYGQYPTSTQPMKYAQLERVLPASTKRNMKAPNLSIREKQALRTAQTHAGRQPFRTPASYHNPYDFPPKQQIHPGSSQLQHQYQNLQNPSHSRRHNHHIQPEPIVPAYEAPKLRTRAARKGPKIDTDSDESADDIAIELDSEGPEVSESEHDEEGEDKIDVVTDQFVDLDFLALESRVLHYINIVQTPKELADLATCTDEVAKFILNHRPFANLDQIRALDLQSDGKRPSRARKSVGLKVVEMSLEALEGYEAIDFLVAKCEIYGREVKAAISQWGVNVDAVDTGGALDIVKIQEPTARKQPSKFEYLSDQPVFLPESVRLKDYQLFGVSWLHLMYQKNLSGILADEMGLGKTCQIITFLGVLLEKGNQGPHLVVVPASTLENWLREISRFCPSLKVEAYYGSQRERNEFRDQFEGEKRTFNVMVTTYQLATGAKDDRSFLKRQSFDVCVYDEGHNLKNSSSSRYRYLMAVKANFRVLLTGTPLQNNLKELISLLAFVLPKIFAGSMDRLDSIFKIKAFGDSESIESALLSQQRIKRAKTMMTPFILRRYKKDVLDELPQKKYRIDFVDLNEAQQAIYNEILAASQKSLDVTDTTSTIATKDVKSAVNVMMQLRKCSNHPMLFRRHFNDRGLKKMARALLKEEVFKDSEEKLVIEDMEVMTDFELNRLCLRYPTIQRFALEQDCWMQACKVQHLKKIIPTMKENGDRILLFSQFTQTLDILEDCMDTMGITYFRLDGSTDVSARQDLIDQFHEEVDITVFLLSTKAGGFGINLACANVVIIYDSSFNPHDDKQAEDRAHRVGQTKEVQIIRLVTRNTIEEHIAKLAGTKLTLDSSVSGSVEQQSKAVEDHLQRQIAQTLFSELRK